MYNTSSDTISRTKNRTLNFSTSQYCKLTNNIKHRFAARYSMQLYLSDSIFTFIPKNACSTMRYNVAKANGAVDNLSQINWIHENNDTFSPSLKAIIKAKFTFVILRCPYSRLVSCYLDKIAGLEKDSWNLYQSINREIHPTEMSFYKFIHTLKNNPNNARNMHWKPQVEFLLYKEYDQYFSVEEFERAKGFLKKTIGFEIEDTREVLKHGQETLKKENIKSAFHLTPLEIQFMKGRNYVPTIESMYNDELKEMVANFYQSDLILYKNKFGSKNLTFGT